MTAMTDDRPGDATVVFGGGPPAAGATDPAKIPSGVTPEPPAALQEPAAPPYRPWLRRLLEDHPGAWFTTVYLVLTGIGLNYSFWYYLRFRVRIVDYAATGDFLVAAIREPAAIALSLLPAIAIWAIAAINRQARRRIARYAAYAARSEEKYDRLVYRRIGGRARYWDVNITVLVFLYAVLFTLKWAVREADRVKAGLGQRARVYYASDAAGPGTEMALIGTTSQYLFLYDRARDSTTVVPTGGVARVVFSSARPPKGAPGR